MRQVLRFPKWARRSERRTAKRRQNALGHLLYNHRRLVAEALEERCLLSVAPLNVALVSDAVAQAEQIQRFAAKDTIAIIYHSDTMTTNGLVDLLAAVSAAHDGAPIGHVGIVAHGGPGELDLGKGDDLTLATMPSQAAGLGRLRSVLTSDARLDLYACSVAAGPGGKTFTDALSAVTGVAVFASDNPVGTVPGSDFIWEYHTGQAVESNELFSVQEMEAIPRLSLAVPATPTNPSPGTTSSPGPVQASSTVTWSWDAMSGATSYNLGVTDIATGSLVVATFTSTNSYTTTLAAGKAYRWNVASVNSAGQSLFTALRYFQTPTAVVAPATPTNPTPGTTSSPGPMQSSSTVTLRWDASAGATYYNLGVRDMATGTLVVATFPTTNSYTATLDPGKAYRWNVAADNASGESAFTTPLYFQTPTAVVKPSTPTNPAPGTTSSPGPMQSSSTITLSWNASIGATYYNLGVVDVATGVFVVDTTTTSLNYTATLTAGKTYRWNVAAGNTAGLSSYTTDVYFWTQSTVTLPTITDMLLTQSPYTRPGDTMGTVEAVVIHYVGNPGTSAVANRNYFESLKDGPTYASAHYIVGLSGEIIRAVPESEVAYHAGGTSYTALATSMFYDNSRGYVWPHDKAIGIETCHPDSTGQFSGVTEDSVVALAADIVRRYQLSRGQILRHYDVTGKQCPLYYVQHADAWNALVDRIMNAVSGANSPVLTVSAPTLTLPTTTRGTAGATTSFTVSGSSLTPNASVQLTAPAGTQISLNGSSAFANVQFLSADANGSLNSTPVYARISASAEAAISDVLSVVDSADHRSNLIAVTGLVQPTPTLTVIFPEASTTVGTSGSSTVTFTVSLTASLATDLLVPYQTQSGTAVPGTDYEATSGTLRIPAGQVIASVGLTVHGTAALDDRTFFVVLSDPAGYVLSTHSARGTIYAQVSPARINGLVWNDLDGNGNTDTGEPGLAGWTVTLHAALQPDQTATTSNNGRYSFCGLIAGTYTLSVAAPAGWNLTAPAGGTLISIVSAGDSVDDANFGCQIQPAIVGQNYAVLFSGGAEPAQNYPFYYSDIKMLYQVLTTSMGLSPANIYILYADGTNDAPDQSTEIDSDMSFAYPRSTVVPATKNNLQDVLGQLATKLGSQDHFLFWTGDHGHKANFLGLTNPFDYTEYLVPWLGGESRDPSNMIKDDDLATWLKSIHAGYTTYVFNQCYSGGMLDDLLPLTGNTFGCAATSLNQVSFSERFGFCFIAALQNGLETGKDAFDYALDRDVYAHDDTVTYNGVNYPNEDPWYAGGGFPIFATASCPSVNNLSITPFQFDFDSETQAAISYDRLLASLNGLRGSNAGLTFRIDSVDAGTLSLNGQSVQPGVTELTLGQSLTWRPSGPSLVQINAFDVSAWQNGRQLGSSLGVNFDVTIVSSLTAAVNDLAKVVENDTATTIDVLANDAGLGTLRVLQVGAAQHGFVTLRNGQVFYEPDRDYYGLDGFSYTMSDESNTTGLASVVVTVTAVPQNPETIFHLFQVVPGTTALLDVRQGDYDPDGTSVTLVAVGVAQHGTVQLVNGQAQYVPEAGYTGADQFGYTIADGNAGTGGGIAYVTVVRATPVFSNLSTDLSIAQGTASVAFSGTISAGTLVPPTTETVAITLNGVTQNAAIDLQGNFSTTFDTSTLRASLTPYQVAYAYAGDESFNSIMDNTTTQLSVRPATTIGIYNPADSWFHLRNSNSSGPDDYTFGYGVPNGGWQALVGDWEGSSDSGVGLFDPSGSTFYLTCAYTTGVAEYTFGYGEPNAGWVPLVGDWDGNGTMGVGLYDPHASTFYLTNNLTTGYAQYTFGYGEPNAGWIPIIGDWDGNGTTGVGLYDPHTSTFYLTNNLMSGYAQYTFGYGVPEGGWKPLIGDWDGNGTMGVGLYDPHGSTFYLTNNLVSGYAQYTFGYGVPEGGWKPLIGDWDGNGTAGVGLYDPTGSTFYLTNTLQTGFAEYAAAFGQPGVSYEPIVGCWTPKSKPAAPSAKAVDQLDLAALVAAELAHATEPESSLSSLSGPATEETDWLMGDGV